METKSTVSATAYLPDSIFCSWEGKLEEEEKRWPAEEVIDQFDLQFPTGYVATFQLCGRGPEPGAYVNAFVENAEEGIPQAEPAYRIGGGIWHDFGQVGGARHIAEIQAKSVEPASENSVSSKK